jgi:ubiquinone/menaquinone biosynthesis C-methylase UbiE
VPKKIDYDDRQYAVYAQARALAPDTVAAWAAAFRRHAGAPPPLTAVDIGAGIGRFTPALAETFGGPAYGIEPSVRMREVAERSARHDRVTYLPGTAAAIPLPDASCDVALLYLVLHHIPDRAAAAVEIARVLRPGGRLFLHSVFLERAPAVLWHRYFPAARVVEEEIFPPFDEVLATFRTAGLELVTVDRVHHRFANSLAEYAARLKLRGVSTFDHLSEADLVRGFAALDADVAAETTPRPVATDLELMVLARA